MKTKILLFCAVILAVGLIGIARPSAPVGEKTEAAVGFSSSSGPSVFEKTAYPANMPSQEPEHNQEQSQAEEKKAQEKQQEHAQQEQHQAQEKQEQEKQEKKKKEAVVWTIKEGEKHKHKIMIQEGDKVKTIVVGKPIVIKEEDGKKVIYITPEGKGLKILEGKPVHLEIKGDKLEIIKEGKILKVDKDGSSFLVDVNPDVQIKEAVKIALQKSIPAIPVTVKTLDIAKPYISWVGKHDQEELREKIREIREKLKKVEEKELELRVVEEALADLEKDLEKMNQTLSTVAVKLKDMPVAYTIAKKVADAEASAEVHVDLAEGARKDTIKVVVSKDGLTKLHYKIDAGEKGREAYEKIVARVKKDLPEGFALESEFEEESGLVTLKISGPGDKETPKDLVKKITESIRDERKEKKE